MAAGEPIEEQAERSESKCPDCGGEPLPDRVTHTLSNLGYQHDDQKFVCAKCGRQWSCGVPVGEFDRPAMESDLWCDSCEETSMLVHRVRMRGTGGSDITLDLKCPNPECHYFTQIGRDLDANGIGLVGYPQITGQTDGCEPYGWSEIERAD